MQSLLPASSGRSEGLSIEAYANLAALPQDCLALFDAAERHSLAHGRRWYANLVEQVFAASPPLFVVVRQQGRPRLILPLLIEQHAGSGRREAVALANYYSWLYAPIEAMTQDETGPDETAATTEALLAALHWLLREQAPIDAVRLSPLDVAAPGFALLEQALQAAGCRSFRFFASANWYLEAAGTGWAAYLAARPGELRSTLKRKGKRFAAGGGTLEIVTEASALAAASAAYEQVYAASWKQAEPYPGFIPGLMATAAEAGWLRLGIARLQGEPIAAQLWLVAHGVAYIYKLAYDERHASWSAGSLLTAALMQHVLEVDEVSVVDFLTGDDAYKPQWMSARRERWGLVAYNRRTWRGWLGGLRESLARHLKRLHQRWKKQK